MKEEFILTQEALDRLLDFLNAELLLITRRDVPEKRELHSSVRQGIETLFSQHWHKFIDRVVSRSWRGLWNTIKLKLLSYNLRHCGIVSA